MVIDSLIGYNADIILADPPWQYSNYGAPTGETHSRRCGAAKHYPTMPTRDIKAMPIDKITAEQSVLFLWTTWPFIRDAFEVIDAWGFEYKTLAWEWVKLTKDLSRPAIGMGYYTRGNVEPCLLAFKGKPIKVTDRSIVNVIMSAREKHSSKPIEQYDRIDRLYPDLTRRVELFARRTHPSWQAWGNEI